MQLFNPPRGLSVVPYVSGALNCLIPGSTGSTTSLTVSTDWLLPFSVREVVTVKSVWWHRELNTAANVYVGIYDASLNLLTDCAVDASTTAPAYHEVSTTPVTLLPGCIYYYAINQSVLVASRLSALNTGYESCMDAFSTRPDMVATPNTDAQRRFYYKARANAAMLNPAVLSGWAATNIFAIGGFVKQ